MWSVRCKRSAIWLFTWCRHYYNITGFSYQSVLGYSKVKAVHVYLWSVLTIIFSFEKSLKVKQVVGVYSHQSHDWPRVCFVLFSLNSWVPKFVRAVKCFRLLQIHLEELEAGGFNVSYLELLPLNQMLCVLWWWYVYMYQTDLYFKAYVI